MTIENAHEQGRLEARLMMEIQRAQNTVQQMINLTGGEPDWLLEMVSRYSCSAKSEYELPDLENNGNNP